MLCEVLQTRMPAAEHVHKTQVQAGVEQDLCFFALLGWACDATCSAQAQVARRIRDRRSVHSCAQLTHAYFSAQQSRRVATHTFDTCTLKCNYRARLQRPQRRVCPRARISICRRMRFVLVFCAALRSSVAARISSTSVSSSNRAKMLQPATAAGSVLRSRSKRDHQRCSASSYGHVRVCWPAVCPRITTRLNYAASKSYVTVVDCGGTMRAQFDSSSCELRLCSYCFLHELLSSCD